MIGGKSPILGLTQKQADALQKRLRVQELDTTTFIAMRYWHPLTEETVRLVQSGHLRTNCLDSSLPALFAGNHTFQYA